VEAEVGIIYIRRARKKDREGEMFRELSQGDMERFLRDVFVIDDSKLDTDLKELTYKYAELGVLLAKARADYESKRLEFEVIQANLAKEFRQSLPKVTEKAIEEAVIRSPQWQEAKRRVIDAKQELDLLSALVSALEAKKDLLITYLSWKKELNRIARNINEEV
jgi:hypothetical protein